MTASGSKSSPASPTLPDHEFPDVTPSYVVGRNQASSVRAMTADAGRETVEGLWPRPRNLFKAVFENRTDEEYQLLLDFHAFMRGRDAAFTWTDEETGRQFACRFDSDDAEVACISHGSLAIASVSMDMEEVVLGVTGAGSRIFGLRSQALPIAQRRPSRRMMNADSTATILGNNEAPGALKPVPGAPGYWADQAGNIWSSKSGRVVTLRPWEASNGYLLVTLSVGGRRRTHRVHTLVLSAFVSPRPPGLVACHLNGIRSDNRVENLRWDSQAGNLADRRAHGTSYEGERNPRAKLSSKQVLEILRLRAAGEPMGKIAKRYGVSRQCVRSIVSGLSWSHLTRSDKRVCAAAASEMAAVGQAA